MAEYTASAIQTVAAGQNVLFTDTTCTGSKCIIHNDGSGLITLRGIGTNCKARFRAYYNANIAINTGGTVDAISVALALNGEPIAATNSIATPAAIGDYIAVSAMSCINVPAGCCATLSLENTSTQAIQAQNANIIVERIA